ncbi:MAG: sulfite exporter TauE/SafE family protein [Patescibacteria group bacterium]
MNFLDIFIYIALALSSFVNILVPISGSATVTPFLAILTDPHRAIALASFYFLLSGIIRVYIFRKDIQFKYIKPLLPISLVGATIGALSLVKIDTKPLLLILLFFTLYFFYKILKQHFHNRAYTPTNKLAISTTGLLSGFLQGTGLAGSDLRNNFLYSEGLNLSQVHGTTAIIGSANFLVATVARLYTKQVVVPDLLPLLYIIPFTVLGIWIGRKSLLKINKKYTDWIILSVMAVIIIFLALKIFRV